MQIQTRQKDVNNQNVTSRVLKRTLFLSAVNPPNRRSRTCPLVFKVAEFTSSALMLEGPKYFWREAGCGTPLFLAFLNNNTATTRTYWNEIKNHAKSSNNLRNLFVASWSLPKQHDTLRSIHWPGTVKRKIVS